MAPDLVITVRPTQMPRELGQQIERAIASGGHRSTVRAAVRRRRIYLDGHSALDDRADWRAQTWLFTPRGVRRLHATVKVICDLLPSEFTIEAAWIGDRTRRREPITRKALLATIMQNRLGNRIRYEIGPLPPSPEEGA